ncbi:hypothetical protein C4J91_1397 [Pseudomonas sp. R3-52-08]|nr:hypothetical protein C4J91_1397 [Pseudomonas sp. R3-52-08]
MLDEPVLNVGGGLPPIAVGQLITILTDTQPSGASPLPHLLCVILKLAFSKFFPAGL